MAALPGRETGRDVVSGRTERVTPPLFGRTIFGERFVEEMGRECTAALCGRADGRADFFLGEGLEIGAGSATFPGTVFQLNLK